MQDDKTSAEVVEDTGLSEATETSEAGDEKSPEELTFADLDIDDDDAEESKAEPAEETAAEESEAEDEGQPNQSEDNPDDQAEDNPEAEQKRLAHEAYKEREAARRAREAEQKAKQALEAEHIRNYLAEAEGDAEELAQRQLNVEAYRLQQERAAITSEKLQTALDRAVADIDILRTGTEAEKNALFKAVEVFDRLYVEKDANGNTLKVNGDLYAYLQNEAAQIRELTQAGAARQTQAKESAKARTIAPPSRAPQEKKIDPDVADFMRALG